MKSRLENQVEERNENVKEGEILVYSDMCNYNRYMVISNQEVMTGDIQIVELKADGTFDRYCDSMRIININNLQYGWHLSRLKENI